MNKNIICKGLEYRKIEKGLDIDYFIESLSYPINLNVDFPDISRMQFPNSRAILVRTSPITNKVTIHIMKNIDLYSGFCNFIVDLENKILVIEKKDKYIDISLVRP